MENPLVSIITPAYNVEKYIGETIQSVIDQIYVNWELIIVDDGSTDGTAEEVKRYATDKRIKYFYQKNGRQGKARNLAIKNSTGIYLAFLDADDLWTNDKLQKQIQVMQFQNADVIFTQGWHFSENVKESLIEFNAPIGVQSKVSFLGDLLVRNPIKMLSVIVKKEVVLSVDCFNEDLKVQNTEDYQLWLKLADSGCQFYGMDERLFYYRVHSNQSTANFSETVVPKIWTLDSIVFKTIQKKEVRAIMENMLDRFLKKYIDQWSTKKMIEVIELYHSPISNYRKYMLYRFLFLFGRQPVKKACYRLSHSE